jgi:hypothetical protein
VELTAIFSQTVLSLRSWSYKTVVQDSAWARRMIFCDASEWCRKGLTRKLPRSVLLVKHVAKDAY